MGTKGFVGFRLDKNWKTIDNVYGICCRYDAFYSSCGINIFDIYTKHSKIELNNMFNSISWKPELNSEENNKFLFDLLEENIDLSIYENNKLCLKNENDFLNDGLFCEYAYIYNLNTDKLEIYRGFFNKKQYTNQKGIYSGYDKSKYYVHKVCEITRKSSTIKVLELLKNEGEILNYYRLSKYPEKDFLKDSKTLESIQNELVMITNDFSNINKTGKDIICSIVFKQYANEIDVCIFEEYPEYVAYGKYGFWDGFELYTSEKLDEVKQYVEEFVNNNKNNILTLEKINEELKNFNKAEFNKKDIFDRYKELVKCVLCNKNGEINSKLQEELESFYFEVYTMKMLYSSTKN